MNQSVEAAVGTVRTHLYRIDRSVSNTGGSTVIRLAGNSQNAGSLSLILSGWLPIVY